MVLTTLLTSMKTNFSRINKQIAKNCKTKFGDQKRSNPNERSWQPINYWRWALRNSFWHEYQICFMMDCGDDFVASTRSKCLGANLLADFDLKFTQFFFRFDWIQCLSCYHGNISFSIAIHNISIIWNPIYDAIISSRWSCMYNLLDFMIDFSRQQFFSGRTIDFSMKFYKYREKSAALLP